MSTTWRNALPVPTYSLAQCNEPGQEHFYIRPAGEVGPVPQAEFLVPHRKNFYFLVLMRRGSGRHWVDMRPYAHHADTLYLTAPLQVSLLEQEDRFVGTVVGFTAEFWGLDQPAGCAPLARLTGPAGRHALRLQAPDVAFLEAALARMLAEYQQQRPWYLDMLWADLRTVLIYLSRLQQQVKPVPAADPTLLAQFTALVETHYATRHQVAQYAGLLHRSPGYLNERVRQLSGQPALAHIHARLVLEAKRYLFHTRLSVAEISFALGFDDPSYFGRFFRRDTGLSPASYRATTVEMYQSNAAAS